MSHTKTLGLFAIAATALIAFLGAGTASATKLYKYTTPSGNDALAKPTITASLKSGTVLAFSTTDDKTLIDTCGGSHIQVPIESKHRPRIRKANSPN